MSLFATQTALIMMETTRWHSASMAKVRVCTLTLMDYHLSSKNSAHFLKVIFAPTMMFNCKDLSHWPVDITVHYLLSTPLLAAAWRRLSTGWRNTVMTRLKLCRTNTDEMMNGLDEMINGFDENDKWS